MFRYKTKLVTQLALVLLSMSVLGVLYAEPASPQLFHRNPSLSPDGKTLAFDYKGDIWTVPITGGKPVALTLHLATEKRPIFSPDGKWIVYSANYYGDLDLFAIPAEGGFPRRITFNPGNDLASAWTPDGKYLYFYSYCESKFDIFRIPFTGGTPVRVVHSPRDSVYAPSVSPDGSKMLFTYRSSHSYLGRKNNRTNGNAELFLADNTAPVSNLRRLTDNKFSDYVPTWKPDSSGYYFISERDGSFELYSAGLDDSAPKKLTNISDGVQWFTVASKTGDIVVASGYRLYLLNKNGKLQLLDINCYSPSKTTPTIEQSYATKISEYALSPDSKKIIFECGGDIFVMSSEGGYARRVTETYDRERHLAWAPDSDRVIYTRVKNDELRVFIKSISSGTESVLGEAGHNYFTPRFSPDGKLIYFQRDFSEICSMTPEGNDIKTVATGCFSRYLLSSSSFFFPSPDGEYLFIKENNPMMAYDLKVKCLKGVNEALVKISSFGGSSYFGDISADRRFLCYTNYEDNEGQICCLDFSDYPSERHVSPQERLDGILDEPEPSKGEENGKKEVEKKKETKEYDPDFRDIEERLAILFKELKGDKEAGIFIPNSYNFLFTAGSDKKQHLYIANLGSNKPKASKILEFGKSIYNLSVDNKGTTCWFQSGSKLYCFSLKTKKLSTILPANYQRKVAPLKMKRALFSEVIWLLKTGFYDPDLHGVNVRYIRDKYLPLLDQTEDFSDYYGIMSDMLMEFNASHMGFTTKDPFAGIGLAKKREIHFGFTLDNDLLAEGIYQIARIYEGTPLFDKKYQLHEGDFILEVNGVALSESTNLYDIMRYNKAGEIKLLVSSVEDGGDSRPIFIPETPLSHFKSAVLFDWETSNRAYVSDKSGDRIGYILIPRMYDENYKAMEKLINRYLPDKDALILDFRYNTGGRISNRIAEILDNPFWIYKKMRGGRWISEDNHRGMAWQKPVAGLFNYGSVSNAEMMLAGFRLRNLGPSFGTPTAGGVIGTYSKTLVDGYSQLRLPRFAVYDLKGRNLELSPTEPEHFVDKTVIHDMNGGHPQLDAALKQLTTEIDKHKKNAFEPQKP